MLVAVVAHWAASTYFAEVGGGIHVPHARASEQALVRREQPQAAARAETAVLTHCLGVLTLSQC